MGNIIKLHQNSIKVQQPPNNSTQNKKIFINQNLELERPTVEIANEQRQENDQYERQMEQKDQIFDEEVKDQPPNTKNEPQMVIKAKQESQQIEKLTLPEAKVAESVSSKKSPINTLRSNTSQQVAYDPVKSSKILKELILDNIPISEVKQIKLLERKRILIVWLKAGAQTQKEKERDAILIQKGYQVYTSRHIAEIKQKEMQSKILKLTTIVLFSYSDFYNNEETLKQLHQYFILQGRVSKIFIVKPPQQEKYQMHLSGIKSSKSIIELSYPIQFIRHKIAEYQVSQNFNSINFVPLKFWEDVSGLNQIYQDSTILDVLKTKSKVSLIGCLKLGLTLIDQLQQKKYFKKMLNYYAFFHDLYLSDSTLTKSINKNQNYLQRIGIKLLQDPINFYLNPTHEIAINRVLKYCIDVPECLNNIILPLNLVFYKIKEQYRKDCISKRYKNQFICFYQMNLNQQQLENLTEGCIIENLGFIKANLKQYDMKNNHFNNPANAIFIIHVLPIGKDESTDNGYFFIGQTPKDIDEDESQKGKTYFSGFSYVLFNLLNSFLITSHHYDNHTKKHIIEVEFGYIASQIYKRGIINFISEQEITPRHVRKQQQNEVDYQAIIKYQSNRSILDKIEDEGDCLSLLTRYNDAIAYYDTIFAKCKSQISNDIFLLSSFQNKKGLNYELGNSPQNALQYFYNAYNFIRKSKVYSQIQLNVIKCLQRSQQYQKMISFSQTLIDIALKHKFIDTLPKQFLLQLYGLIAKGHLLKNSINFDVINQVSQIMKNYEYGLQIIQQVGEYNSLVPDFYYSLGYYYLAVGKPFDALIYFNKALVIKMTILTENHPQLCPFYQILSVAYVSMHDYTKALNSINSAYFIYSKYYQKNNHRFLTIYEIRGKIFALLNNLESSMQSFSDEQKIIHYYIQKKRYFSFGQRKYSVKNNHIGLFNLIEEKQLTPYFQSSYRKDKSEICKIYLLLYQAKLYKFRFQFKNFFQILSQALILNKEEFGEAHILNLEILYLTADGYIQHLNWKNAQKILKQSLRLLNKLRKDSEQEAITYYELSAKMHEWKRDYKNCIKNLAKMKEIYFRIYGRHSLQNCRVSSKIAKINLLMDNHQQAKLYIVEHEMALSTMLLKAKNDPQSTKLFGTGLDNYIKKIEIQIEQSRQNRGLLLQAAGNFDEAILKYIESIEGLKQIIGEYHPKVARVTYHLGACYLKKGIDECDRALQTLKKSLSIYKAADIHNLIQRVPIHLQLAKAYQAKNQLPSAAEEFSNAIILLRTMKQIGIDFLQILKQISRIVDLIMDQPTLNYLKNIYFIIAKLFSEEREKIKQSNDSFSSFMYGEYHHQIVNYIKCLVAKEEAIRTQIQNIQTKQSRKEKDLLKKLEEKEHIISLQKIKQNFQIRKQLRQKNKH